MRILYVIAHTINAQDSTASLGSMCATLGLTVLGALRRETVREHHAYIPCSLDVEAQYDV